MGVRSTFTAYETKGDFTGAQNIEACGLKVAYTGVKGKISPSGRFVEGNCFNLSTFFFSDWVSLLLWTESWIRSNTWLWEDKGDEKESFNPKRHWSHLRKTKLVRNLKNDVYYNANYNLSGRVGVIFNTIFIK